MADKPKRRTNAVYTNGGPISQIKNFPFKKVYHGTRIPLEIDNEGNAIIDGPFFVTPYQSIACIFVARKNTEETLPPETKGPIRNISYEEWSKPNNEILPKVTEYVEYMDDTHFDDIVSHEKGYLYEFDVDDYVKEHVFQSAKMTMQSKTHEYCIDHVSKLKVAKSTPLDIELTIKSRKYVDRKHRPFSESYIPDDATSGTSDFDERDDDPEDCFCESATDKDLNCISYAMGVDDSIYDLKKDGFEITEDDGDYKVRFNSDKASIWEKYITDHIQDTYWNEYINLDDHEINFMIKENGQIERYINSGFNENPKLLAICNRLCEGDFKTMKDLLLSNDFYKSYIEDWDKNINEGCDNMPLSEFDHYFQEAKMKAKTRKELDDSDFALVYKDASGNKIRKYPINDEAHVKAAARMFPRGVPNKYRKEVAGKILRRAHKFGIDTSGWKSLNAANEKD